MDVIHTLDAPQPIGPYSQAIKVNHMLFCSGQIAIDPTNGDLMGADIQTQTRKVCENIENILKAANMSFQNVIKAVCYMTNKADFAEFNQIYSEYFVSSPARSCVFVSALPKGALVEIEITAIETEV